LASVAEELTGRPASFELTIINADKPALGDEEVRQRIARFAWKAPIWLTRAPTFAAKARLFPGATFVVGADTARRIVDARFYPGGESGRDNELTDFYGRGCRLLVAGRVDASGGFVGLGDIAIPPHLCNLFSAIPADRFRRDISSTQLRSSAPG
jgi:hypothetical protein